MCQLIVCYKKRPTLEELERIETSNKDGAGIAWIDKILGKVRYLKGLTAKQVDLAIGTLEFPYIIHFRLASIGEVHPKLTHPFEMTNDSKLYKIGTADKVLFHNGHYSGWADDYNMLYNVGILNCITDANEKMYSDTRVMAIIASVIESRKDEKAAIKYLEETGQKFALLDVKHGIRIINQDKWHSIAEDICFSAFFWTGAVTNYYGKWSGADSDHEGYGHLGETWWDKEKREEREAKEKLDKSTVVNGEVIEIKETKTDVTGNVTVISPEGMTRQQILDEAIRIEEEKEDAILEAAACQLDLQEACMCCSGENDCLQCGVYLSLLQKTSDSNMADIQQVAAPV